MSCFINVNLNDNPAFKAIKDYFGTNETAFYDYILPIIDGIDENGVIQFTEDFKNNWKYKTPLLANATDKQTANNLKNAILASQQNIADFDRKSKDSDKVTIFGYVNVDAREEGKRHAANCIIKTMQTIALNRKEGVTYDKTYFANETRKQLNAMLAKRLASLNGNNSVEYFKEVAKALNVDFAAAIDKYVGDNEIGMQLQNLISLCREIASTMSRDENGHISFNEKGTIIDEIFSDSRISQLVFEKTHKKSNDDAINDDVAQEEWGDDEDINGEENDKQAAFDETIRILDNKMGLYTSFMGHISSRIKSILSYLPKLKTSKDVTAYDTDGYFDIPDLLDADAAASVIYNCGDFENLDAFINSLKSISEQIPGYESLIILKNVLDKDSNLAWEFYRTFGKFKISKTETVVESGQPTTRISTGSATRQSILEYKFLNAGKSSIVDLNHDSNAIALSKLQERIDKYNDIDDVDGEEVRRLSDDLAATLKRYFPTIEVSTIRNFVLYNGNRNRKNNLIQLSTILDSVIKQANISLNNYKDLEGKIAIAKRHNAKVKSDKEKAIKNKDKEAFAKIPNEINLADVYAEKYTSSGFEGACKNLASALLPYTVINNPLNSKNVLGNQSSNVINNSMITNIISTLQSKLNKPKEDVTFDENAPIIKLANHRSQSNQYNFGPLLIEQRENGKIISYGLFRKEKGQWVPTKYARELVQARLFNGASNLDTASNVLYKGMSTGDYLGTAWINFFNTSQTINDVANVAEYFMRIPSDAPKNFSLTLPKYLADGLIDSTNMDKVVNKDIEQLEHSIAYKTRKDATGVLFINKPKPVGGSKLSDARVLTSHLMATSAKPINIRISDKDQRNLKSHVGETVEMAFRFADKTADTASNIYVMEGVYQDGQLKNAHFKGFIGESIDPNNENIYNENLWSVIRPELIKIHDESSDDSVKRKVSKNHQIFKILRNIFRQELVDAAVALDTVFETEEKTLPDGRVVLVAKKSKGKPVFKKGITNTKHEGLNYHYHFADPKENRRGPIYKMNKDGSIELTGNVFHSDRFVIYNDTTKVGRNYGNEILSEVVDFFYGGANRDNNQFAFVKNGNTVDVVLSKEQEDAIDAKLTEFILDYVEAQRIELNKDRDFLLGAELNTKNIAEFSLNHLIAYVGMNDLFEGDTKFYKNTQTFLKRAKESQASGVCYGMFDITRDIQPNHNPISSPLDGINFMTKTKDADGNVIEGSKQIQMFDTFKAITVFNTTKTDKPVLDSLVSALSNKEIMGGNVLDEADAKKLIYGPTGEGGYTNSIVNDAQSYITFDEWVRRITGRGLLPKYRNLINKLLDDTQELTVDDITDFVQIEKNIYYDQAYNKAGNVISPRQIKNAELVLVPRLIKGTQLEKVAKLMDKLGIDQLNTEQTSKAAQSYVFTLWDNDGNIAQDILDDADAASNADFKSDFAKTINSTPDAIEQYNYNYLYNQLETPQHVNDEVKASLQFVKKVIDNINENSPKELQDAKEKFFKLYSANIKDSALRLMRELDIETDDNGNPILNQDGTIKGLDYQKLYDKLKDELARLGLDSNSIDYCTLNGASNKDTVMPNFMTFHASKFENIVQSLFNNNITRQTLPGFHMVQATNVGLTKLSDNVQTSDKLRYHQDKNNKHVHYIEVKVPASMFGLKRTKEDGTLKTKQEFLDELTEAHLDEVIGYRIPTEGKQSIAVMKIVDFVPDEMGSTIIVPDAWVAQTGADFDVDSIYGFSFKTYVGKDGKIRKVEYHESFNDFDYFRYVNKHLQDKLDTNISAEISADLEVINNLNEMEQRFFKELQDNESAAYSNLPRRTQELIKAVHNAFYELNGELKESHKKEYYLNQLIQTKDNVVKSLEDEKLTTKQEDAINKYIVAATDLIDYLEHQSDNNFESKSQAIKRHQEVRDKEFEKAAKDLGLESKKEWLTKANANPIEYNSRDARNNAIIQTFIDIMSNSASLEENLSRSNFDDVTDSLKKCIVGDSAKERKFRSPYNVISQVKYQGDAMSGAKLKAFSVTRDTFCSVCNQVKPSLANNSSVKVFYSAKDYYYTKLKKSFDNVEERKVGKKVVGYVVTHDTLGWSNNNKNVEGKILTAYSSQTTAHILDAIKSGNVPNVNDLTFQIYKTFVDIGSNYDTAVSFIMQPGVREIVDAYESSESIYARGGSKNYLLQAVRSIANSLEVDYSYRQSVEDILASINAKYITPLKEMYGSDFALSTKEDMLSKVALNANLQIARLQGTDAFIKELGIKPNDKVSANDLERLFDLVNALYYDKVSKLARDISTAARVSNPDKFGAKQTIFATRQVFEQAIDSINSTDAVDENGDEFSTFRLQVDGKHILKAIYPGIEDGVDAYLANNDAISKSKYPTLAAFMKYATALSIKINKTLFATQNENFINVILSDIDGIEGLLSHGRHMSERTYKEAQQYLINHIALRCPFINTPLEYKKGRGFVVTDPDREPNVAERSRVLGYAHSAAIAYEDIVNETSLDDKGNIVTKRTVKTIKFKPSSITNPTNDDIKNFNKLSPAQKVQWVKANFRDAGIFNYLESDLYNEYAARTKRAFIQRIYYNEGDANIETIYKEFDKAFTSKNPLVACAAADLVKYAFIAEGYRIGMRNVSKIIPNSVLLNGLGIYGTGIVTSMKSDVANLENILKSDTVDKNFNGYDVRENFIRSHASTAGIEYHKVNKVNGVFELVKLNDGLSYINLSTDVGKNLAEKFGVTYKIGDKTLFNKYVLLGFDREPTLYKIRVINNVAFLIPLNQLEANETGEWSANGNLRKFYAQEYYETYLDNYERAITDLNTDNNFHGNELMASREAMDASNYKPKVKVIQKQQPIPLEDINDLSKGYLDTLNKHVTNWVNQGAQMNQVTYIWLPAMSKHITEFGIRNGITDRIQITDNTGQTKRIPISISKVEVGRLGEYYTGRNRFRHIEKSDAKKEETAELIRFLQNTVAPHFGDTPVNRYYGDIYAIRLNNINIDELTSTGYQDPNQEEYMSSAILDNFVGESVTVINRHKDSEPEANKVRRFFDAQNIARSNAVAHTEDVIPAVTKYALQKANDIEEKLRNFVEDPDNPGTYLSVVDPKCIELVKANPKKYKNDYLRAILAPKGFVAEFALIKDLDIDSEDPDLHTYLKELKQAVDKMQNSPLSNQAMDMWGHEYIDRLSDNPLIKQGLFSALDGFYRTNWLNAWFNDIGETSNPIIQVTLKNFNATLRAYDLQARRDAEEFVKHVEEIKRKANAAGKPVDLNKIFDEYGRFKQKYTQQLIDDRNKLRQNVDDAKAKYGEASIEHLKAELEYNKWKAKHLEQEVKQEYYDELNANYEEALNAAPEELSRYEKARRRMNLLRNKSLDNVEQEKLDKELNDLEEEIYWLTHIKYPEGDVDLDEWKEAHKDEIAKIDAIRGYMSKRAFINRKYYKYDPKYNFETELNRNIKIINRHEINGTTDTDEYKRAKLWMHRNVQISQIIDSDANDELKEAYDKLGNKYTTDTTRGLYGSTKDLILHASKYRDTYGDIDGNLVPESEIDKLLKEEQLRYHQKFEATYSDRTLIGNGNPRNEIYTSEFYEELTGKKKKGDDPRWVGTITKINDILAPYYDEKTGKVNIQALMSEDGAEKRIDDLRVLYDRLDEISGTKHGKVSDARKKWIKAHVSFSVDKDRYNADLEWIKKSLPKASLRSKALDVIQGFDFDGSRVPNRFLYGYVRPKTKADLAKYVDNEKTWALQTIDKYTTHSYTTHYYEKFNEMSKLGKDAFNEWYLKNHVYNPYKHKFEPLPIWTKFEYKTKGKTEYSPKFPQQIRKVRDGYLSPRDFTSNSFEPFSDLGISDESIAAAFGEDVIDPISEVPLEDILKAEFKEADARNPNWKPIGGQLVNYKVGSNPAYDNNTNLNEYEQELSDYIQQKLMSVVQTPNAQRRIEQGWAPVRRKHKQLSAKDWGNEVLKTIGWTTDDNMQDEWYGDVEFYKDKPLAMPMLEILKGKGSKDTRYIKKPKRSDYEGLENGEELYQKKLAEYTKEIDEIDRNNLQIHKELRDPDVIDTIREFIVRAGAYNGAQEAKYDLFYAQQALKRYGVYEHAYTHGGHTRFKKDSRLSSDDETTYLKKRDEDLIKQLDVHIRRVLYNQFKMESNPVVTKLMSTLQGITSAQNMMLNVRSGIANVTVGEASVIAETFAREYFGKKEFIASAGYYAQGTFDYIINAYSEKSTTVQGATIKFFDVVDYDENTGVSRLTVDAQEVLKRIRNLGYVTQSGGEHAMQNRALFAMLMSHRLVPNPRAKEFGQPKYTYMNEAEYIKSNREELLKTLLTDKQKAMFEKALDNIKKDANITKNYAWYQIDITNEFVQGFLSNDKKAEFYKLVKDTETKAKEEFNKKENGVDVNPTLLSQLELGKDGKLAFKEGSKLAEMDVAKEDGTPTDALQLLANFKGRVVAVNKKIHGSYDKSGRAQFEKTFIGSLIAQFHKHLPIGLTKRYRSKGMFQEERGTVEKGMYRSLYDYLSIPFRDHQKALGLTDEQVEAGEASQTLLQNIVDFALHAKLAYRLMPEYDKANFRRMGATIIETLGAFLATILLRIGWDDDDSIAYNLALYELDRYATEVDQYIPFMFVGEAKKLYSSPMAANGAIEDALSSANMICHMILDGDDFDGEYHSGRYAGENKLSVYVQRRIPIWRGIRGSFIDIIDNNSYYKLNENFLGFMNTDKIAETLK